MQKCLKHAGLSLAAVILAAGLSACKEEKDQKTEASTQAVQQQSRSDLKSGFGGETADRMDTANITQSAPEAAEGIPEETTDAMIPAPEDPSMEITTGSVGAADDSGKSDAGAGFAPAHEGDAVAVDTDKPLSEDEKFAAELAKEAEEDEAETQAATKGESR